MNKKKISLLIIILLLIILIISTFFIHKINNKKDVNTNSNNITTASKEGSKNDQTNTISSITNTTSTSTTSTTLTTKEITSTTSTTNKTTSTTKKQTTKETTTTTKKLSCPDGYTLENNKCTKTIDAVKTCPPNMADVGGEDIPQDEYCINLSEGYETTDSTCPDNYTMMKIITIGSPDKYRCIPLHKKEYKCEDGYTLHDTNKCTISINPQ